MKKLMAFVAAAVLATLLFPVPVSAATADNPYDPKLMAGQHYEVGNVLIWNSPNKLYIQYRTWDPSLYCLLQAHAHVADTLDGIPQNNGNPTPGEFMFKAENLSCRERVTFVYDLPAGWVPGQQIYIAAHAVVMMGMDRTWQETAWGIECGQFDIYGFPGSNWAAWMPYTITGYPIP